MDKIEIEEASSAEELMLSPRSRKRKEDSDPALTPRRRELDDRLKRIVRQDFDRVDNLMAGQDSSLGREVGLNDFKLLVYGGLIFFVILSFPQFSFYGECRWITWRFSCTVNSNTTSFQNDAPFRYVYTEVNDPVSGLVTGMYVQSPPQCGSGGFILATTIPPDHYILDGGRCIAPLGNGTYTNFTQDLYRKGSGNVIDAGTAACRIHTVTSSLALAAVILLVTAFIIDQGFGTISEETQKIDERAAAEHAINPEDKKWLSESNVYPAATVLTFATMYNFATACVMFAHCILIAFLATWQNDEPPDGEGCEGPGSVGKLLIVLASLSIFVEFIEWVYNSYRNYLPNFVRSVDGIAGVEAVLINYIIDDHYTQALVSLEDTGEDSRPDPVLLRNHLREMRDKSKMAWLNRGDPRKTFKYFTFYRACCCCAPPLYFVAEWCDSRKQCLLQPKELDDVMEDGEYKKFLKDFGRMEDFLFQRLLKVSQKLDEGYFPDSIYKPSYTFEDLRVRLKGEKQEDTKKI